MRRRWAPTAPARLCAAVLCWQLTAETAARGADELAQVHGRSARRTSARSAADLRRPSSAEGGTASGGAGGLLRRLVGNASSSPPILPEQLRRRPVLAELEEPGSTPDFGAGGAPEVLLGVYLAVRGVLLGATSEGVGEYGAWGRPVLLKVAMLAFANGLVLEPAASPRALSSFGVVFADACKDVDAGGGPRCASPYAIQLANKLLAGSGSQAPVKALLGGMRFTAAVAQMASAAQVPNVGFHAKDSELGNKLEYPYFVRTNPTADHVFTSILAVVRHFNYTTVDVIGCDGPSYRTSALTMTDLLLESGIAAVPYLVRPDLYSLYPPGTPMDKPGGVPDPERSRTKKEAWDSIMRSMLAMNAHVHVDLMDSASCPKLDFMSYITLEGGLSGTGHLWVGDRDLMRIDSYEVRYLAGLSIIGPQREGGVQSDYRFAKPMDGYILVTGASTSNPVKTAFWELMSFVGQHQELLGPQLNGKLDPAVFSNPSDAAWWAPGSAFMVDALFAALIGIDSALSEIGPGFSGADLLEPLRRVNFMGLTGRVQFDVDGNRILRMDVQQYTLPPGTEQVYFGLRGRVKEVGYYLNGSLTVLAPWSFFNGSTSPPPNRDLSCGRGRFYERPTGRCHDCSPGRFAAAAILAACEICSPGTYTCEIGASMCHACHEGYAAADAGSTNCTPCLAGTFNDDIQQSMCRQCPAGTFSGDAARSCEPCPQGFYAFGRANMECAPCPAGFTTQRRGSTGPEACVCPEGFFLGDGVDECLPCPEGMHCALGADMRNFEAVFHGRCNVTDVQCAVPVALSGHMTRVHEPLRVFRCLGDTECPGGLPGTCGALRDASVPACAWCSLGAYEDGNHCEPCGDGVHAWPIILAALGCVAGVTSLAFIVNRDLILQSNSALSVIIIGGLTVSAIQTMGIFRSLAMDWFEPLKSIYLLCSLVSFNLDVLRLPCVFPANSATSYIIRQFVAPFVAALLAVVIWIKSRLGKCAISAMVDYMNTLGTIFSAVFISIAINIVLPLVCYTHPDGASSSMQSHPGVLCWESPGHWAAVGTSMASLAFVLLPFVTIVLWATLRYKTFVVQANCGNLASLNAFRFLFFRFHLDRYYYGVLFMMRSLVLCFVPVVVRDNAATQVCVMAAVIISGHTAQMWLHPWKTATVNLVDGCFNAALLLFLVCGAASFDFQADPETFKSLGTIIFALLCFVVLVGVLFVATRKLRPSPRYQFFICHHKRDAAAQARYLKMMLQMRGKVVFIDSDDLKDLNLLFDTVRTAVEHLVVYLTRDILTRPWCAGEIVTAVTRGIAITKLQTSPFEPPEEAALQDLPSYLDLSSTSLTPYHISFDHIADAYRRLFREDYPLLSIDKDLAGLAKLRSIPSALLGGARCAAEPRMEFALGTVVVVSDPEDDEASAAAGIIATKIRPAMFSFMREGIHLTADPDGHDKSTSEADIVRGARCLFVLLSARSLQSAPVLRFAARGMARLRQAGPICAGGGTAPFSVVPVAVPGFMFPAPEFFEKQLFQTWPEALVGDVDLVRTFFKRLAITLSTDASDSIIESQAAALVAAVPRVTVAAKLVAGHGLTTAAVALAKEAEPPSEETPQVPSQPSQVT